MHRLRRTLVLPLVLLSLSAAACGGDRHTGIIEPEPALEGSYTLRTVNGTALPYTFASSDFELRSATTTIAANGQFTSTIQSRRVSTDEATTASCTGTWARSGSAVTFTPGTSEDCARTPTTATWSAGNTITAQTTDGTQGYTLVYTK